MGRLGRRLLAQADANQVLDFVDTASGQEFSQAFAAITTAIRQDPNPADLPTQPWFEDVVTPGIGVAQGYANNTQFLGSAIGGLVANGDMGDFIQALSSITPYNVGSAAQFSENSFHNNEGFSSYNGLLLTLSKNTSHGLHYDANYTWSHSIDNISFFANSQGDTGIGGGGLICDVIRPRECRASSDFDVRQYFTADANYDLPFGRKQDVPLEFVGSGERVDRRLESQRRCRLAHRIPVADGQQCVCGQLFEQRSWNPDRQPLDCEDAIDKTADRRSQQLQECRDGRGPVHGTSGIPHRIA